MITDTKESRFICDRMVGSLCRYLRLMGYDTMSANDLPSGDPKEDTKLLAIANNEDRIILTRDAELAQRDPARTIYLHGERIEEQIRQLLRSRFIIPELRLTRCSLCNSSLIHIPDKDLVNFPGIKNPGGPDKPVFWCPCCMKAYWEGSHTSDLRNRITGIAQRISEESKVSPEK